MVPTSLDSVEAITVLVLTTLLVLIIFVLVFLRYLRMKKKKRIESSLSGTSMGQVEGELDVEYSDSSNRFEGMTSPPDEYIPHSISLREL